MDGCEYTLRVHRILWSWPGPMRVACTFRVDAHANSIERDEHRVADQPGSLDRDRGDISADSWQVWIFDDVFCVRRMHCHLLHYRGVFPAGDQRETLEEIEAYFEGAG